jgi:hypothetical protein
LCREVFEAPRLNLTTLYSSHIFLTRGLKQFSCAFLCIPVQNHHHRNRIKSERERRHYDSRREHPGVKLPRYRELASNAHSIFWFGTPVLRIIVPR